MLLSFYFLMKCLPGNDHYELTPFPVEKVLTTLGTTSQILNHSCLPIVKGLLHRVENAARKRKLRGGGVLRRLRKIRTLENLDREV